jgi:DNA polymerase-3 subunit delta'
MAFTDFSEQSQGVQLLQRSLARGRLGHAYLFTGHHLEELESLARTLAKTLNCQNPVRANGVATDCCENCLNCRKISDDLHADVHWARPESKSRVITIDQTRELTREIQLKPTEEGFKIAIISGTDRLNVQAANAFLKTLEEPPKKSVLILLSTEPSGFWKPFYPAACGWISPLKLREHSPPNSPTGFRSSVPPRRWNRKVSLAAIVCSIPCCNISTELRRAWTKP